MPNATRDLIIGTPRRVGEPVTDLEGNVPAWVFALHPANVPPSEPALAISQSSDPRAYLRDLRKDKRSGLGARLRYLEEEGIPVEIRLLHEILVKPGVRYSPELKAYTKLWNKAVEACKERVSAAS